jgi:hypothetical protein
MTISARFVKDAAKVYQDVDFTDARAGELALEVERLNTSVRAAATRSLDFDAEPSAFFAVLAEKAP